MSTEELARWLRGECVVLCEENAALRQLLSRPSIGDIATALGYATVWIDGWLRRQGRAQEIGKLLGVPEGKIVRVLLPLGVPEETWPQREKKPFQERAWFNRYGG